MAKKGKKSVKKARKSKTKKVVMKKGKVCEFC